VARSAYVDITHPAYIFPFESLAVFDDGDCSVSWDPLVEALAYEGPCATVTDPVYIGSFDYYVESSATGAGGLTICPSDSEVRAAAAELVPHEVVCMSIGVWPRNGACCDPSGACTEIYGQPSDCPNGTFLPGVYCSSNPCHASGVCSPITDTDGDKVENNVDQAPNYYSVAPSADDNKTPRTVVSIASHGGQDLCLSAAVPRGIKVQSLGGSGQAASVWLICSGKKPMAVPVGTGVTVTLKCGNSGTAHAVVGDTEPQLLKNDVVVGTVFLPEGNSVTYEPDTLEVTAPPTNDTTLTVVTPSGEEQPVTPGGTTTLPGSGPIPAVSTWGLGVLTLLLLVGGKIYFHRRRAVQA
jgi:hypothetical protein